QALCATTAAIYLSMLGKEGMRELANINAAKAAYAKKCLSAVKGVVIPFEAPTFNEFVIETNGPASEILAKLEAGGILGGVDLGRFYPDMKRCILVCATEMNTREEIDRYADELSKIVR
ncbi:MAG: glycine dehydrogenase, partial [bacterium]